MSDFILFISSGMLKNKKKLQINSLYLNYGFLGLASLVNEKYNKVKFFQANSCNPEDFFYKLEKDFLISNTTYPIFISIPSFFAVDWAQRFILMIKKNFPEKRIVIGGRWIMDNEIWIKDKFPSVDIIVKGHAEELIDDLLDYHVDNKQIIVEKTISNNIIIPKLDYTILDGFLEYSPSIELSRGCGRGCSFCADKDVDLSEIKTAKKVINEILELINVYDDEFLTFYFESSIFQPSYSWVNQFTELYNRYNLKIKWRCETRVDSLSINKVKLLSNAGLKIIDLGLESASEIQLRRMNKTINPLDYLKKASDLLKVCYEENIWVKVNILLYPGENLKTISDTINWLNFHKEYIKGLSVYPLILYGTSEQTKLFFNSVKEFGATMKDNVLNDSGITYLNLSDEISYSKSLEISKEISKDFMTQEDYYELKKFNYFSRGFTYDNFMDYVSLLNENELPFRFSLNKLEL